MTIETLLWQSPVSKGFNDFLMLCNIPFILFLNKYVGWIFKFGYTSYIIIYPSIYLPINLFGALYFLPSYTCSIYARVNIDLSYFHERPDSYFIIYICNIERYITGILFYLYMIRILKCSKTSFLVDIIILS